MTPIYRQVLAVACSVCGAEPLQMCVYSSRYSSSKGKIMETYPHSRRVEVYYEMKYKGDKK